MQRLNHPCRQGRHFAGGALVVSGVPSLSLVTILQCLLPQFPLLPVLLQQLRLLTWLWVLTFDRNDPNDACSSPSPNNDRRLDQPECETPLPVVMLLGIVGGLRQSRSRQQSVGPVDYPLLRSPSELGKMVRCHQTRNPVVMVLSTPSVVAKA
jgi:hypothetical protein